MSTAGNGCSCCKARFIKFRLTEKLTCDDHRQQADVEKFWDGDDPNPSSGPFYVYNLKCDESKWAYHGDVGSTGFAVLDDQNISDGPEEEQCFYRIIELPPCCGWPAIEIDVEIAATLKSTDTSRTGELKAIRSPAPFNGTPEDVGEEGIVAFQNPYALDAMCDSIVTLQRKTKADGSGEWVMVAAKKKKARWIKFHYDPEETHVNVSAFWEGENPTPCGTIDVEYPLQPPCKEADVIAFYDPRTDTYQAVDTEASMLGKPETMDIVQALNFDDCQGGSGCEGNDTGCGINYLKQQAKVFPCGSEPGLINTQPNLVPVNVINHAELTASALAFSFTQLMACSASPVSGMVFIPLTECEEPEECGGYCRYEWLPNQGGEGSSWQQTVFCEEGCDCITESGDFPAPGQEDPHFKEFPCVSEVYL